MRCGSYPHNSPGPAVIPTATAYSRGQLSLDLDAMPDNAEALTSVQQATLTSGAIGYRKFNVVEGYKIMGIIAMNDNTYPPFGASVKYKPVPPDLPAWQQHSKLNVIILYFRDPDSTLCLPVPGHRQRLARLYPGQVS